ncbi:MAG: hypothetical protein NT051_00330 [Candidatus Micrarchaeota archaeon]|nr:hypothetical protein [Candidatus Micrarchaeota archaeon]
MGFEELSSELHKNAEADGRKLLHAAEKSAERIMDEARAKAEESVKAAKKEASEFSKQESSERITSAKLAAKKMVDEARDEAVEECISQVWHEFKAASLRKSSYPMLLGRSLAPKSRCFMCATRTGNWFQAMPPKNSPRNTAAES